MTTPLIVMAVFYIVAGINHFINKRFYLNMMPSYLPFHKELNIISGIMEIIIGVMLFYDATRVLGAWLLIALLVAVFPANVQMAVDFKKKNNPYFWATIVRLPLQVVLIWWAWLYTK